jgi:hypothetical protein
MPTSAFLAMAQRAERKLGGNPRDFKTSRD